MNTRIVVSGVLAACLALSLSAAVRGGEGTTTARKGEKELEGRDLVVKLMKRDLRSSSVTERVIAIRKLGQQTDKALVEEFLVVEQLVKIAQDNAKLARERSEALESLVSLYGKGIGSPDTLGILMAIVEDEKQNTPNNVRMDAMMLVAEMAEDPKVQFAARGKAFAALEKLWRNRLRSNLPQSMRAAILNTLGNFPKEDSTKKMLEEGLQEKSAEVRAGALRGLQVYLDSVEKVDSSLVNAVILLLKKSTDKAETVELILVIDQMVSIDADALRYAKDVKAKLMAMLEGGEGGYGSDEEVRAAVRVLVRVADDKIVEVLLKAAKPDKARSWDMETYTKLSNALVDIVDQMRGEAKRNEETVNKIAEHFAWMLNSDWLAKKSIPEELAQNAILNLGMWPREFDRKEVVKALIRTLAVVWEAGWQPLIEECEKSLKYLTGQQSPRKREKVDDRWQERPDLDAWKVWFEANSKWLEPPKHPTDR